MHVQLVYQVLRLQGQQFYQTQQLCLQFFHHLAPSKILSRNPKMRALTFLNRLECTFSQSTRCYGFRVSNFIRLSNFAFNFSISHLSTSILHLPKFEQKSKDESVNLPKPFRMHVQLVYWVLRLQGQQFYQTQQVITLNFSIFIRLSK